MKKYYLLLAMALIIPKDTWSQERGDLVSDSLVFQFGRDEILDLYEFYGLPEFLFPIIYNTEIYKIVYWTIDAKSENLTLASGLVNVPADKFCQFPLLCYNHGTLEYDSTLSDFKANFQEHFTGIPFAANGYVTVLPDYLGYGATPKEQPHAYYHAKSEASAVVDMLRAAKNLLGSINVNLNDQLFLLGYSHGAHVTLATQRELESSHQDQFQITASAAGSGAYDISGMMRDSMIYSEVFSNSFFIAFVSVGYKYVYGDIYDDLNQIYKAPYDSLIPRMLNRDDPQTHIRDELPDVGYTMFQPTYMEAIVTDSLHPLNLALKENDVYNWRPQSPLRLYYCEADNTVPYENTLFTEAFMKNLGATDVVALSAGDDLDHGGCVYPALVSSKLWFDTFLEDCTVPVVEVFTGQHLTLYPNPFKSSVFVNLKGARDTGLRRLTIYDWMGRKIYAAALSGLQQINIPHGQLAPGPYIFELRSSEGSVWKKMVKGDSFH